MKSIEKRWTMGIFYNNIYLFSLPTSWLFHNIDFKRLNDQDCILRDQQLEKPKLKVFSGNTMPSVDAKRINVLLIFNSLYLLSIFSGGGDLILFVITLHVYRGYLMLRCISVKIHIYQKIDHLLESTCTLYITTFV